MVETYTNKTQASLN